MSERTGGLHKFMAKGDWAGLFERLDYDVRKVPIPASALNAWGWRGEVLDQVTNLVAAPGFRVTLVEGAAPQLCRALALTVARQNPTVCVLWVFVTHDTVTFAIVDHRADGGAFLRKMSVTLDHPDPVALGQVERLAKSFMASLEHEEHGEALRRHLIEVLDQEGLTREFFDGFRTRLELLRESMQGGPGDPRARHELSLVVLLRLVFLYFLQRERLLNDDPRFLVRHLRGAVETKRSYWDSVLRPLFFGVLNTEVQRRDERASALGSIPFLNGGLFEPIGAERSCSGPRWSNEVWQEVIEGFFERFHFTTVEPDIDDENRVVDPEMLGKVFEGLMYGDDRRRSGAFYTPRDVVRRMVDETVLLRLTAVTELPEAQLRSVDPLPPSARRAVIDALESFSVLDPAVGTGAFLLEALHVLRRWYRRLGLGEGWGATRDIIHRHLYGVDIEHTAIRICELRLWLAMLATGVASGEPLPPLPNLSHRIAAGNSLVDPGDLGRLIDPAGRAFVGSEADSRRRILEEHLDVLQTRYLGAHGAEKHAVRRELAQVERQLQRELLASRRDRLEQLVEPLESVERSVDLFGQGIASRSQLLDAGELREQLATLERALADLDADRTSAVFAYLSRFGEAARIGFDVVVTNPPWVRANRVGREAKQFFGARYRSAANTLWPTARALGIRAPFGTQQDLAALFLERSLELLRPGGILCALVPSKLLRSLHGSPLRAVLAEQCVDRVEDLSEAERNLFAATTYPAILTVRKGTPEPDHRVDITVWRGRNTNGFESRQREIGALSGAASEPWLLVSPALRALFARMYAASIPLGAMVDFTPSRGVFTGANDVFVRGAGEFARLFDGGVEDWVRPVLTGASLGEGPAMEILWAYDQRGQLRQDAPEVVRTWFTQHRARLAARSDRDERLPDWQVFRVQPHTLGPKVAWRDIAPRLEAELVDPEAVPLNTVYYLPCLDDEIARNIAAWMNSLPVRALARELAERARGGWRRHFAWVVRMLPVPRVIAEAGFRSSEPVEEAFGLLSSDLARLAEAFEETEILREEAA